MSVCKPQAARPDPWQMSIRRWRGGLGAIGLEVCEERNECTGDLLSDREFPERGLRVGEAGYFALGRRLPPRGRAGLPLHPTRRRRGRDHHAVLARGWLARFPAGTGNRYANAAPRVCVGLQVIFEASDEQDSTCLGWFPGRVRAFDRSAVRVPHMAWNRVSVVDDHPFVAQLPQDSYFYFVNSNHAVPGDPAVLAGTADYDGDFTAIVARGHIMATQLHIEKSGPVGLNLLSRFASLTLEDLP